MTLEQSTERDLQGELWGTIPRRRPWLLALLAFFFGAFVFVYCGRLRRGLAWLILWWFLIVPVCGSIMLYSPHGIVSLCGALAVYLLGMILLFVDALRVSRTQQGSPWRPYQKWWAYLIAIFLFGGVAELGLSALRTHWSEAFVVSANSMKQTLLSGDRFMLEKLMFDSDDVQRGEVVAFRLPSKPNIVYVKRIIALEGEALEIKQDQVFIDDEKLVEPYVYLSGAKPPPMANLRDFPQMVVPAGHVFVMGDSRWASFDSRFWGVVPVENLVGKASLIFWSREHTSTPPTRENPNGTESWGKLRWDRIGRLIE